MPVFIRKIIFFIPFVLDCISIYLKGFFYKRKKNISQERRMFFLSKKVRKILKYLNIKVEVHGTANIPKEGPCLIVANHSSILDSLFIIESLTRKKDDYSSLFESKAVSFLGKNELKKNIFFRGAMYLTDSFFIERNSSKKSLKTLKEFGKFIRISKNFGVVFPEGTRSKTGKIQQFKKGAFLVAKEYSIPILPTTINFANQALKNFRNKTLKVEIYFSKNFKNTGNVNEKYMSDRIKETIEKKFKNGK